MLSKRYEPTEVDRRTAICTLFPKASAHSFKCVLGISVAAIFLSSDQSLYALITSYKYYAWLHLYGLSRPARSALKVKKNNTKWKSLPTTGLEPITIRFLVKASTDWASLKKTLLLKWPLYISPLHRSLTVTRTRLGRMLVVFCVLKANTGLLRLFDFCLTEIYFNMWHNAVHDRDNIRSSSSCIELIPMCTLVAEVYVCINVTLKG